MRTNGSCSGSIKMNIVKCFDCSADMKEPQRKPDELHAAANTYIYTFSLTSIDNMA